MLKPAIYFAINFVYYSHLRMTLSPIIKTKSETLTTVDLRSLEQERKFPDCC